MSLRLKIILLTFSFLATAFLIGTGAVYIFDSLSDNLNILYTETYRHKEHNELLLAVRNLVSAAEGWATTGQEKYRQRYYKGISALGNLDERLLVIYGDRTAIRSTKDSLSRLMDYAGILIETRHPVDSMRLENMFKKLKAQEDAFVDEVERIHFQSIEISRKVISSSEKVKSRMKLFLALGIALALATSAFLVLLMRRVIERPYSELLRATEKVASGDLRYRIRSKSPDEFGIIAKRFDAMVDSLEDTETGLRRKLRETELFLDISKMASALLDLRTTLLHMSESIAVKMKKDMCGIFLYNMAKKGFVLEACNTGKTIGEVILPVDSEIAGKARETLTAFILDDVGSSVEIPSLCDDVASLMVVPIVRDSSCFGILMLGTYRPKGFETDEVDTAMILAHTIGTTVRNIELYQETKKQVKQLSAVYELSKVLTSMYEPDEILRTVSSKIAELINAKGCVIRLVENGNLKIRSHAGKIGDLLKDKTLPIGKGIAGWVAKEGRSLFVEDIANMPEHLKTFSIAAKSAIAVPLKKDEKIIGTLGLYDKFNENGDTISFSLEDLAVAEGFASLSAIVLEKARIQELQEKTEDDILKAKKRMEFLFDSVQGGIVTMGKDFTILSANRYVERWVDLPLGEILHNNALNVFHGKEGICPHCAAKVTFDEGIINSITQSSGLNYADLTAYPVKNEKGEVEEVVVFIQDITERVLYQEEIMGLYREVMQTKEYMEGLINNSADAIVTTDIEGVVKSWNPAAEAIYGFRKDEAVGAFLPFVPESQLDFERDNIEKIKAGEVLKLETIRQRKDNTLFEVSLTLSPIKDVTGDIIGISGISRDITEKKRVEKELIRRNQELSRLFFISSAMRGTLELDRLLRMVLTAVTMSDGLGFNRAILFLIDKESGTLKGTMGVGPASPEEAWDIWEKLSTEGRTLPEIMREIEESPQKMDSFLDRLSTGIEVSLEADTILTRAAKERKAFHIRDIREEPFTDMILVQQLGTDSFAVVPLVSRGTVIGVLWVDNQYNKKPITEEDMKFLAGFADQVASAIEAARLFHKVSLAEAELENIFRSISDMVFFTDKDYTVKNVNQAVMDKLGKPKGDIVGHKCYEVFHGMDVPMQSCPHHKTVENKRPFVEELEDPYLGGTYISSTAPMFDADGEFQGTVHVARDISEMKELRVKLHSAERMAALGEVAAKVAHEIRNPLVSVGGFAKRLEERLTGNEKEYAHIIQEEVRRLENILKDILGFVKEIRMAKRLVDLNDIMKGVLDLLEGEFSERKNTVVKELSEGPVMVKVDPDRIKEALFNIVANANQATDSNLITVRTYSRDRFCVLEVEDSGCGIRSEDMYRIFDPFFTTRPTGTGLGLTIAKRVLEEHEGTVEVESGGQGQGTKFTIKLPLREDE